MAAFLPPASHNHLLPGSSHPLCLHLGPNFPFVGHQSHWVWVTLKAPFLGASLVAQRLKPLPPMWETWVRSLGWEDPLEKEMVTHSNILAWRIPWTEEAW